MSIEDKVLELIKYEKISKYINEKERNKILEESQKYKKIYDENKNDERVVCIILYNIILQYEDLKNKKLENGNKKVFTIKNLSSMIGISDRTFSTLNKKIFKKDNKTKKGKNKSEFNSVNKIIKKYKRHSKPSDLTKKKIIGIFKYNYEYLKLLYSDKTAIKIKEYIAHIYMSLFLAGYNIEYEKIEELFGRYCKYLNIVLTDGRDSKDFVKIKDIYDNEEFKVYIEFMR
ncbi:hypothetical protein [Clostridium cochlearium]|uniref:Uncharacterized protein n=1 Tax=Clostridium cochlearium TaxID=1494 RepID=A0ABY0QMF3_CLOCO|nr:hypothetical protein [Clostridium cochlearium]NME94795.1 hypothetical protein [Clostridium cochlearium]SDL25936.1 hypothetical protein SAMN05216497_11464 [Clostridium cochlearium]SNV79119.1 Uncharacterised protein [Clostridium cochlearium]STA92731.1 Uncharacterised protein [Clostridium cochlearium]